ncbi:MAG: ferritin family protein [Methanobacteriota archaeon]|nr:MAG: ferritin family protein [Euryarchaeota archaeon]
MDLSEFNTEDLLLAAIKSEIGANEAYTKLAGGVKNAFLKDRLKFLAEEEMKHRETLITVFKETFMGKEPVVPDETPVPLPDIVVPDEKVPLSRILQSAMDAEIAAHEFYKSLTGRFDNPTMQASIAYLAAMEMGHYNLLQMDKQMAEDFEDYDEYWPMMHAGP